MLGEGGCAVVRQGQLIALVGIFLIGCAVLLLGVGCSGTSSETSGKEQASSPEATASEEGRCQGTRTITPKYGETVVTNDVPGCPKGGLLLGTDKSDGLPADRPGLDGGDGDDTIRGLGGNDEIFPGSGDDVVYLGPGNDDVYPDTGKDVIYGGDGNDFLASNDPVGQGTSSIAAKARTATTLIRTTTCRAAARRSPSHRSNAAVHIGG